MTDCGACQFDEHQKCSGGGISLFDGEPYTCECPCRRAAKPSEAQRAAGKGPAAPAPEDGTL